MKYISIYTEDHTFTYQMWGKDIMYTTALQVEGLTFIGWQNVNIPVSIV